MARPPRRGRGGGGPGALGGPRSLPPPTAVSLVPKLSADSITSPATPAARLEQLLATLTPLRDPQARFAWAVERARQRPPLPEELRVEAHRVAGCQVRLWFVAEFAAGRCRFRTDADAVTLKAMTGLLCDLCSDGTPAEIAAQDFAFLDQFGLLRQLAENRRATVLRVAEQIRAFAATHV